MEAETIADNYHKVLARIHQATLRSGRKPAQVRLVVVTKTQPVESIQAVVQEGAIFLGENYAEDGIPKIWSLSGHADLQWHMIGHIQSRKARLVSQHFHYVHSLDSVKVARLLDRFNIDQGLRMPVLLECNVSGEASKSGWSAWKEDKWEDLISDFEQILSLNNLEVRGLMTIPPLELDAEQARPYFQKLRRLKDFLAGHFPYACLEELSMGMSADFEVAIEEGATWVRVGQAIFGPRPSTIM